MHSVHKAVFGLLAAAAVGSASDVTQLKKDTFDDFIKANDIVLAECKFSSTMSLVLEALNAWLTWLLSPSQSSPPGAVTARPSPPSTRRLPPP